MEIQFDINERDYRGLLKAIDDLPGLVGSRVQGKGMLAAARVIRDDAQKTAAFIDDTGNLRKSIKARRQSQYVNGRRVAGAAAQVYAGGDGARQAFLIEYGHGGNAAPAHPFLEPAIHSTRPQQLIAMATAMRGEFVKVAFALANRTQSATISRLAGL